MIRDVLPHGISDMDIRREVLGVSDILETAVNEVIFLVESKENGSQCTPVSDHIKNFLHSNKQQSQETRSSSTDLII